MRALRDEIGARRDRRLRQIVREREMRAVRLVDEERHARLVHDLGDGTHVGGDAVIRRRNEQQRFRLRMQAARLAHSLRTKPVRYAKRLVNDRLDVDGTRIGKHETAENGAMHVARHKHGVARRERGHEHRMDRARRAVDGEKGRIRSIERGGEILRLLDAARRLVQIVKLLHQRDLFSKACFRHEFAQERMRPQSLLVSGRMKGESALLPIRAHGGGERRASLSFVRRHFFAAFSGASTFGRNGMRRWMHVPLPISEMMLSSAPMMAARSLMPRSPYWP